MVERYCALYCLDRKKDKLSAQIESITRTLQQKNFEIVTIEALENLPKEQSFILALGGDGTMLRASQLSRSLHVPVLGVSGGYLGFLLEVEEKDLAVALDKYLAKDYFIDKRNFLEICDKDIAYALNEITFKSNNFKMIELDLYLNDMYLTTYKADGLIVSTSTGSTAYNLSAGGPIIFPDTQVLIITPICPHSLTVRSLVLSSKDVIKVVPCSKDVNYSVDGNDEILLDGQSLNIIFSNKYVEFIRFSKKAFIDGLRNKLNWSGKI